mmetsp:Transcript_76159/g.211698  ORF Transcript_76159/g.211698 Transcript_76159/m.211698 type:complete len:209 (-) Transcript_76159:991-1617(-)
MAAAPFNHSSLQAEALGVVHGRREHPLELPAGLMVAVLGEEQQVEARVRRGQSLRGLATVSLNNQLQLLEASDWRQVATRDERQEALLLAGVEGQQQLPEGHNVGRLIRVALVVRVAAQLAEVQILLAADDHLELCTVQGVEQRRVADASHSLAEGLELALDACGEQPRAVKPHELFPVVEGDGPVLSAIAELPGVRCPVDLVRHCEV